MSDICYSLEQILCPEQRGLLSLVGAGGKTSLLFHLAHQLARSGKRVLTTTTTKIFVPTPDQSQTLLIDADPAAILLQASTRLQTTNHITAAAHCIVNGKLHGFAPEAIRAFRESGLFDWILVEADGAASRPLKAPAGHEPVIPPDTTLLVAVAGLEVIGQRLSEELVFRSALAAPLMGLAVGEIITESALARLFAHPSGCFKEAPPLARRFIFLNKADSPERCECGSRIAEHLRQLESPPAEAMIVGQALNGVKVHAVHQLFNGVVMSRVPRVTGIVLAAGRGRRMGQTKQLLPFQGQTILECVVDNALASKLHRIIVVLGYQADAVEPLMEGRDVTVAVNPSFENGQSSSLKSGLQAVTDEADAVLFLLGDQPLVTTGTINHILSAYGTSPASPIVAPSFEGKRGNPVLFSRETFYRIESLSGDCGARPLFQEYSERILQVPVEDPCIHFDLDTEEDYRQLLQWERRQTEDCN